MSLALGISAYYHDSAAAMAGDGELLGAAQEERFSRRKHDAGFPRHAVNFCLERAFVEPEDLDAVVFYEDPVARVDRVVRCAAGWPAEVPRVPRAALGREPYVDRDLRFLLDAEVSLQVAPHHACHAASAFFPSPFEEAAILTLDGVGEWQTGAIGHGCGAELSLLQEQRFPHSLGLLYAAFTAFTGFRVNSDEYKMMGLAAYGEPCFADAIRSEVVELGADGSVRLDLRRFSFLDAEEMHGEGFAELFGPPRSAGAPITDRDANLAASIQAVTEEAVLRSARHALEVAGSRNLVMAGGVALNAVANGRLHRAGIAEGLWIQPAAGDAGGALGAALLGAFEATADPRRVRTRREDGQRGSLLGPEFSSAEVRAFLDGHGIAYRRLSADERAREVAAALAGGKIVGHAVGPMEFGPRALGCRSILADPRPREVRDRLNHAVKHREGFRPFAPAVLSEKVGSAFEFAGVSPYMLLVAPVRPEAAESLAAVTHVDGSARLQTVAPGSGPLREVIEAFEALTGCPAVLNTSFNLADEPIVCAPEDAYASARRGDLDLVVLGDCLVDLNVAGGDLGAADRAPFGGDGEVSGDRGDGGWSELLKGIAAGGGREGVVASEAGWRPATVEAALRPYDSSRFEEYLRELWQGSADGLDPFAGEVAEVAERLAVASPTDDPAVELPNLYPMF